MSFTPISIKRKPRFNRRWLLVISIILVVVLLVAYYVYRFVFGGVSARWDQYRSFLGDPQALTEVTLLPGQRCDESPFAFPTTGVIFGLWGQSYGLRHRHQGLDIFAGTEPGVTPVYAAYPGYLTRESDWVSTVIVRVPQDPLEPQRQIWLYYTHMADVDGNGYIVEAFPPGTGEVYIEAGTLLGYQGDYSGNPVNPTGLHLHFSIVKDDGNGNFLNELEIGNTIDPTPYFNLPLSQSENPDELPRCEGVSTLESWGLDLGDE